MQARSTYYSYLLRIWCTEEKGQICWRASLQSPRQQQRITFRSLQRLFAYLEDQTAEAPSADASSGDHK